MKKDKKDIEEVKDLEVNAVIDNDPDWVEVDAETAEYLRKYHAGELDNERWYTLEEFNERHGYKKKK